MGLSVTTTASCGSSTSSTGSSYKALFSQGTNGFYKAAVTPSIDDDDGEAISLSDAVIAVETASNAATNTLDFKLSLTRSQLELIDGTMCNIDPARSCVNI